MELVPMEQRKENIPCHHIPLTGAGDTLDSIYRWGTPEEVEEILGKWLKDTVRRLEEQQGALGR
jgi:hypothetical protein